MSRVTQKTAPVYNHLRRILIDGVMQEVLVMREDPSNGDIYFIKTLHLDKIDKERFVKILKRRDAHRYELWDLLSQVTLPNGQNALVLYHQLVRVLHTNGKTSLPGHGFGVSHNQMSLSMAVSGQEAPKVEAPKVEATTTKSKQSSVSS
jgi:hypothetical protein